MHARILCRFALTMAAMQIACGDQTLDTSEARFLIQGTIKAAPLPGEFRGSEVRATLAHTDAGLLDVVCAQQWGGGGSVVTSTTDQLGFGASSLAWPAPKARAVVVLTRVSNHERGLRHQDGRALFDPGDLYGETEAFETTRPCEVRPLSPNEPCRYTGYFVTEMVLDHVFEGCPDSTDSR